MMPHTLSELHKFKRFYYFDRDYFSNMAIWCVIWFKRIRKTNRNGDKCDVVIERTDRGKAIMKKKVAKMYPYIFTDEALINMGIKPRKSC